ncbi:DUF2130 domain-containing protein [candidate division TA06 bacterium]|nr:DUF2130 domain-containing protein [candidate division TA06 bacterium]
MTEPTITCPQCGTVIKLNESLAGPLIESIRQESKKLLEKKDADIAKKEAAIRERETEMAKAQSAIEDNVADRIRQERVKIVAEESKKARHLAESDLQQKTKDLADLQEVLKQRDSKLAEAQKAQADLLKKQRELDDAKRELELTVEKRVQKGLTETRDKARTEVEEQFKLKVAEKEQTISSMQKQIEELKRKSEQGSQQLQGEVQELELENILRAKFPFDVIEPVPKGEHGGDVLQRVVSKTGQCCGVILWESKRTKGWSDGWLAKLREDQRMAKAEVAVLVSQVLPKGIESFDFIDGIMVAHPRVSLPVATMLRQSIIEIALARQAGEGQQTKMEMLYEYLTGTSFRRRVQAIVEAFSTMKEDLDKEKKVIIKQWAKRDEQIERVMQSTVGMYGDLQGIAGKTIPEIEGLDIKMLESPDPKLKDKGDENGKG